VTSWIAWAAFLLALLETLFLVVAVSIAVSFQRRFGAALKSAAPIFKMITASPTAPSSSSTPGKGDGRELELGDVGGPELRDVDGEPIT
jgi:hypothetical protein